MRFKRLIHLVLFCFCALVNLHGQDTLLMFHPTAYNLEVAQQLIDEKILDMDGYHLLGVYHELETYDYQKSVDYIKEHKGNGFSVKEISGSLSPDNIFGRNACTEQFHRLFQMSQGALFMGGPDIPPVVYNEPVHLLTSVTDPFRHYCEASFIFHMLGGSQNEMWSPMLEQKNDYLISGICLGMQTMNVATGGTMVQDIPSEIYGNWIVDDILALPPDEMHRNYNDKLNNGCEAPTSYHFHHIRLEKKGILKRKMRFKSNATPLVLSSHHQALESLGQGLVIAAMSMDEKIIEAIEHEHYPNVLGVQFHPEKPGLFDPSIEHLKDCNSTINFQEAILHTDSYKFHLGYWKYLGKLLQKNRNDH